MLDVNITPEDGDEREPLYWKPFWSMLQVRRIRGKVAIVVDLHAHRIVRIQNLEVYISYI